MILGSRVRWKRKLKKQEARIKKQEAAAFGTFDFGSLTTSLRVREYRATDAVQLEPLVLATANLRKTLAGLRLSAPRLATGSRSAHPSPPLRSVAPEKSVDGAADKFKVGSGWQAGSSYPRTSSTVANSSYSAARVRTGRLSPERSSPSALYAPISTRPLTRSRWFQGVTRRHRPA